MSLYYTVHVIILFHYFIHSAALKVDVCAVLPSRFKHVKFMLPMKNWPQVSHTDRKMKKWRHGLEGGKYLYAPDTRHTFVKEPEIHRVDSEHSNIVALFCSHVLNSLNICHVRCSTEAVLYILVLFLCYHVQITLLLNCMRTKSL